MDENRILKEVRFKAVRSGGPGGQHANKVSTKVILEFDISGSSGLNSDEKERLLLKLRKQLVRGHLLRVVASGTRSQLANKQDASARLLELLQRALVRKKTRKPTKPGQSAVKKRLDSKKRQGLKKALRAKPRKTDY